MSMWLATCLGGLGGSVRGFLAFYHLIGSWHQGRRRLQASADRGTRKRFADCLDWQAESIAMATQVALGAVAGLILNETHTVTGVAGAIIAGAAAPAILGQLGHLKPVHDAVIDDQAAKQDLASDDTITKGASNRVVTLEADAGMTAAGTRPTRSDGGEVEQEEAPSGN